MDDQESNQKPTKEWSGPQRIDTDGETIMVSAGMDDMDPESLVEPTEPPPEEVEEERERLSVKVKLTVKLWGLETSYTGSLVSSSFHYNDHQSTDKSSRWRPAQQSLLIKMPVEEALQLYKTFCHQGRQDSGMFDVVAEFDYVWCEPTKLLKSLQKQAKEDTASWYLEDFEIREIEHSVCVCFVKLRNQG